jgi:hypothetical protein
MRFPLEKGADGHARAASRARRTGKVVLTVA